MAEDVSGRWWSSATVAVVTGGHRGLGYEIADQLVGQGMSVVIGDFVSDQVMEVSAARLKTRLKPGKPSPARILYHHLDVRSDDSVKAFVKWLKDNVGEIDILVNNAGIATDGSRDKFTFEVAQNNVETNFLGAQRVTKALLPLMKQNAPEGARIVSMTSRLGGYGRLQNEVVKAQLKDVDHMTEDLLKGIAKKYLEDVKAGRTEEEGWISPSGNMAAYSESKMLLTAYVRMLARALLSDGKPGSILVSALCPGATDTTLISEFQRGNLPEGYPLKTMEDGADTAVWLILLPRKGYPHGKLLAERQEFSPDIVIA